MKRLVPMLTLVLFLLMTVSCGTFNVNGRWRATLTGNAGSPSFVISMRLHQEKNGILSVTELNFSDPTACFPADSTTASGAFTLSSNAFGGSVETVAIVIQSSSTSSTLGINGTIDEFEDNGNGTWTLVGSTPGCTGVGTLILHRL